MAKAPPKKKASPKDKASPKKQAKVRRIEHWKDHPEDHDFPAAHDYLSLVMPEADAARAVKALEGAPTVHRKAKDLLRASGLGLLPVTNAHVRSDLEKVNRGELLSPVLLVRGAVAKGYPLVVADGYHRICASYAIDENADIPCRLVDLGAPRTRPAPPAP